MRVIIVTARDESMRGATACYLAEHFPTLFAAIERVHMRAADDFRPSPVVKAEIIANIANGGPVCCIDDDRELYAALVEAGVEIDSFVLAPEGWEHLCCAIHNAPEGLLVCVDFDGTLTTPPAMPDPDFEAFRERILHCPPAPLPAAVAAIREWLEGA